MTNSSPRRVFVLTSVTALFLVACATTSPRLAMAATPRPSVGKSTGIRLDVIDTDGREHARITRLAVTRVDRHGASARVRSGGSTYSLHVARVDDGQREPLYQVEMDRRARVDREYDFHFEAVTTLHPGKKTIIARVERANGTRTMLQASLL